MDVFTKLFGNLLAFVYHCFDRIVIHGYLSALSRPEQVVHFVRKVVGVPVVSKEILSQRTPTTRTGLEAYARNHRIPIEWTATLASPLHELSRSYIAVDSLSPNAVRDRRAARRVKGWCVAGLWSNIATTIIGRINE